MNVKAYLAGPEVFLPDAQVIGEQKKQVCHSYGIEGEFPLQGPPPATQAHTAEAARAIFKSCIDLMDQCQLVIANLTPFRGVSMDVGTAVEMGYMFASGRPVFGYTNVAEDYAKRVPNDGLLVEQFGLADNLMCEGPVRASGGSVVRRGVPPDQRFTDLTAFEECVRQASANLGLT